MEPIPNFYPGTMTLSRLRHESKRDNGHNENYSPVKHTKHTATVPSESKESEAPQQECAICMATIDSKQQNKSNSSSSDITTTACAHVFHTACLKRWLKHSDTCPLCRTQLRRDASHHHLLRSRSPAAVMPLVQEPSSRRAAARRPALTYAQFVKAQFEANRAGWREEGLSFHEMSRLIAQRYRNLLQS